MIDLIFNMNLLLAQTQQEKNLTILYVSLFVFLCLMLVIDAGGLKKYNGPKVWKKIFIAFMFIGIVALAILYFVI